MFLKARTNVSHSQVEEIKVTDKTTNWRRGGEWGGGVQYLHLVIMSASQSLKYLCEGT